MHLKNKYSNSSDYYLPSYQRALLSKIYTDEWISQTTVQCEPEIIHEINELRWSQMTACANWNKHMLMKHNHTLCILCGAVFKLILWVKVYNNSLSFHCQHTVYETLWQSLCLLVKWCFFVFCLGHHYSHNPGMNWPLNEIISFLLKKFSLFAKIFLSQLL